jgi:DNA-binding transcriptional LysR family regulator
MVDLIGEGFDAAIRIAALSDSSLVVRRLREMLPYLVGSPIYLHKHGRPKHPLHLAQHRCIGYSYTTTPETWRFTKNGKSATVRPSGPLRVNNGDAMLPALIAGTGLGILPEFILREALAAHQLERLLPDWSLPSGGVYWVTPWRMSASGLGCVKTMNGRAADVRRTSEEPLKADGTAAPH